MIVSFLCTTFTNFNEFKVEFLCLFKYIIEVIPFLLWLNEMIVHCNIEEFQSQSQLSPKVFFKLSDCLADEL